MPKRKWQGKRRSYKSQYIYQDSQQIFPPSWLELSVRCLLDQTSITQFNPITTCQGYFLSLWKYTYPVAEPSGYRVKPVDQKRQQAMRANCPKLDRDVNPTNFNHTMREKQNWVPKAGKVLCACSYSTSRGPRITPFVSISMVSGLTRVLPKGISTDSLT